MRGRVSLKFQNDIKASLKNRKHSLFLFLPQLFADPRWGFVCNMNVSRISSPTGWGGDSGGDGRQTVGGAGSVVFLSRGWIGKV